MGFDLKIKDRQARSNGAGAITPLQPIDARQGDSKAAGSFGYHTPFKAGDGTIESAIDATGRRVAFINGEPPEQTGARAVPVRDGVGPSSASVALATAPSAAARFGKPAPGGSVGPSSASATLAQAPSAADVFSQPPAARRSSTATASPFPASPPLSPEATSALRQAAMYDTTHPDAPAGASGSPPPVGPRKVATPTNAPDPFAGYKKDGAGNPLDRHGNPIPAETYAVLAGGSSVAAQQARSQAAQDAANQASERRFPRPPATQYGKLWQQNAFSDPNDPSSEVSRTTDRTGNTVVQTAGGGTVRIPAVASLDHNVSSELAKQYPALGDANSPQHQQFLAGLKPGQNDPDFARKLAADIHAPAAAPDSPLQPAATPADRPWLSTALASGFNPPASPGSPAYNPAFHPPLLQPGTPLNTQDYSPRPGDPSTAAASAGTRAAATVKDAASAVGGFASSIVHGFGDAASAFNQNVGDFASAFAPADIKEYADSLPAASDYSLPAASSAAAAAASKPVTPTAAPIQSATAAASPSVVPTNIPDGKPLMQTAGSPIPDDPASRASRTMFPASPGPSPSPAPLSATVNGTGATGMLPATLPSKSAAPTFAPPALPTSNGSFAGTPLPDDAQARASRTMFALPGSTSNATVTTASAPPPPSSATPPAGASAAVVPPMPKMPDFSAPRSAATGMLQSALPGGSSSANPFADPAKLSLQGTAPTGMQFPKAPNPDDELKKQRLAQQP